MNETRRHFDFQQPHSMFGTWIGVVLLFIVFALFVWVVLGAIPRGDTYEEKRAKARMEKLEQLHKDATAALTSYAWVDKNKGTVRIPVERAMELTMADLASKKPTAAGPIATPAPAASAPPTGAPAPSAQPSAAPQSPAQRARRNRFLSKVPNQKFAVSRPARRILPPLHPARNRARQLHRLLRRLPAQRNQIQRANPCRSPCNHRPEVRCRLPAKLRRHEHFQSDQPT